MATVYAKCNMGQKFYSPGNSTVGSFGAYNGCRAQMWIRETELYQADTSPSVADYGVQFHAENFYWALPNAGTENWTTRDLRGQSPDACMMGMGAAVRIQDKDNYYAGFGWNHWRGPDCRSETGGGGWYLVKVVSGVMTVLDFEAESLEDIVEAGESGGVTPWRCEVQARGSAVSMKVRRNLSGTYDKDLTATDTSHSAIGKAGLIFIHYNYQANWPFSMLNRTELP